MSKRVRITNDSLNSYGFRVLTKGMSTKQYECNPVLLYMHERGNVIGFIKELKIEDGELTGEPVFDEASELSQRCKKQFDFGSLRMVSVSIDILEMSEDKEYLVPGQTRPTITKCKLMEVSLVDIGANDDAIVLRRDGKVINLGKGGECCLPLLNKQKKEKEMEQKVLALQLGLPETATEEEINAKLTQLKAAKEENEKLQKENDTLQAARITAAVEKAVSEKRIGEDKKDQFVELGKKIGVEELEKTFGAMSPQVKLSEVIGHQGGAPTGDGKAAYAKLSDVPGEKWEELKEKQPEEYKRLYKEEYGMECEI